MFPSEEFLIWTVPKSGKKNHKILRDTSYPKNFHKLAPLQKELWIICKSKKFKFLEIVLK